MTNDSRSRLRTKWGRFRRRLRRWNPLTGSSEVQWVYSDRYAPAIAWPVVDTRRGQRILSFLDDQKILRRGDLHRPRRVALRDLLRVHTEEYLRSLESVEGLSRATGLPVPAAQVDAILFAQRSMVAGTVHAARVALNEGRILVNLGGGLHHATRDRGSGICLFNDIAVAIRLARRRGFRGRILVVDLDLHDGDGTRALFAEDASVHTYSVHNRDLGEAEAVESTSIALGTDVEDALYLETIERTLPPLIDRFAPELVFYLAGMDPAFDDRLGDWHISEQGLLDRDRHVMGWLREREPARPIVVLLAGGYGHSSWRHSARSFAAMATGQDIDPPETASLPLREYRRFARYLSDPFQRGSEKPNEEGWGLTEEDLPGPAPLGHHRVLGRFSLHGVELALERLGFFDRVRTLGHRELSLEADLDHPLGQTLRLVSNAPTRTVVMELRGRPDKRLVEGAHLLFVEWLLSQNPGAEFAVHRPGLEGQQHPGTGLLRDIASLLLVATEHLGLDGIAYIPSHVSLALLSRQHAHFVDCEQGGRFQALRAALGSRSLVGSLRCLEAGAIVDAATGEPYRWEPTAMVVPVGGRMRDWVEDPSRVRIREAACRATAWIRRSDLPECPDLGTKKALDDKDGGGTVFSP